MVNSKNTLRNPVPAVDASIPLSVNVPSNAVVSSIFNPALLATGATLPIAVLNFCISNDELENDLLITSVTHAVCSVDKPNARTVAPTTVADSAKSVPVALAKSNVAFVTFDISDCEKPNFANSVCRFETSVAVKRVVDPYFIASSVKPRMPSRVTPKTDAKFALA